jgi:hypothetical protein
MGWKTLDEEVLKELEVALEAHEKENPQVIVKMLSGKTIPEGTPIEDLLMEGGVVELELY